MQELVELSRLDPEDCLLLRDQPFIRHVDRNFQRRLRGALAGPRLQHPELAVLDGEFDVLHVAVMRFELVVDARQLREDLRHQRFERGLVAARLDPRGLRDGLRRADAGHHVFALGVHEEFAVKPVLAGRGVARERDARGTRLPAVAEHHGLDVDGRSPAFGDMVQLPVSHGAGIMPGVEDGGDRAPELVFRVLRERAAELCLYRLLILGHDLDPVRRGEVGVEVVAVRTFVCVEHFLEGVMRDVEHHVRIHLDEAAIGIVGETPVAGLGGERFHGLVVEAEIEDGVHHAGHRGARPGPDRHEQRVLTVAEAGAHGLADRGERAFDLLREPVRHPASVLVIGVAHRRRNGETGRHGEAEIGHLGEVCALAAEQITHVGRAIREPRAETVNPLRRAGDCGFRCGADRCAVRPPGRFAALLAVACHAVRPLLMRAGHETREAFRQLDVRFERVDDEVVDDAGRHEVSQ